MRKTIQVRVNLVGVCEFWDAQIVATEEDWILVFSPAAAGHREHDPIALAIHQITGHSHCVELCVEPGESGEYNPRSADQVLADYEAGRIRAADAVHELPGSSRLGTVIC